MCARSPRTAASSSHAHRANCAIVFGDPSDRVRSCRGAKREAHLYERLISGLKAKLETHTELLEWALKWAGYLVAAVTVLWTALLSLAAKNELHLVVWIEEDRVVYPSEATRDRSLPLRLDATPARSVRLLAVRVSNYGRTVIGKPEETWELALEAPFSSAIQVLDLDKEPPALVASARPGERANGVALEIGALEPKAAIALDVMLVNAADDRYPLLKAKPSLAGLPYEVIPRSPAERMFESLAWHVIASVFVVLLVLGGPASYAEARAKHGAGWPLAKSLLGRLAGLVVLAFISGILLAKGVAHVMSWFL